MQKRMVQSGVRLAQLALARLAAGVSGWLWVCGLYGLYASAAGLRQRVIAVRQHDRALGGSVGSVGACPCERWRCARPRTSGTPDGPHRPGRRAQRAFDSARPRPSRPGHARVHAPRPSAPHCWCRRAPPSCPSREASAPRLCRLQTHQTGHSHPPTLRARLGLPTRVSPPHGVDTRGPGV